MLEEYDLLEPRPAIILMETGFLIFNWENSTRLQDGRIVQANKNSISKLLDHYYISLQ